jgi:hypothetical protein
MIEMISVGFTATDLDTFYGNSTDDLLLIDPPDTYHLYKDTLRLNLERNGPILGAIVQIHFAHDESLV